MPTRNPKNHQILRDRLMSLHSLAEIWTRPNTPAPLNSICVGYVLAEAYYTSNPWVSAQYIVSRVGFVSVDTVRRMLEAMVDEGMVEFTEIDRKRVYRALPMTAEATIQALAA